MTAQFEDGKDEGALRTIGEVGQALDIKPHVLRYWEEQFPTLEPLKRSGNRRYYRPGDVALIETINRLVNVEGYTIKGARVAIEEGRADMAGGPSGSDADVPDNGIEEASLPNPVLSTEPANVGARERAPGSAAANADGRIAVAEAIAELKDIRARLEAAIAA